MLSAVDAVTANSVARLAETNCARLLPQLRQICYALGVKGTPGTLQEGGASFATTHWSVVAQSALTDVPEAETALARLCEMYWDPIYSFVRRRGYTPPDAQDLTQNPTPYATIR